MLPGGTYGAALSERRGVIVSTLGITQTLAWGSTYYLPAVFADPVSGELGLARSWFFGIFSGALLLSGLLGPLAGRMIDRHGGRAILPATNLTFAAGLALLSLASGIAGLAAAWIVIGVGMGFGLYEAAFATVTGLYGHSARNAITGITLFAGFASTVGWPTSAFFIDAFGWRGACLAWAALHVLIGLPLNRLLVPKAPSPANEPLAEGAAPSAVPWTMIVLAFVFGATWFVSTAMAAHLPRLLEAFGVTTAAAVFAASLVGPDINFSSDRPFVRRRLWPSVLHSSTCCMIHECVRAFLFRRYLIEWASRLPRFMLGNWAQSTARCKPKGSLQNSEAANPVNAGAGSAVSC